MSIEYTAQDMTNFHEDMHRIARTHAIRALAHEAASAGDTAQVLICNDALKGNRAAIKACVRVINEARAQQ